jgi:hypothetical protein
MRRLFCITCRLAHVFTHPAHHDAPDDFCAPKEKARRSELFHQLPEAQEPGFLIPDLRP